MLFFGDVFTEAPNNATTYLPDEVLGAFDEELIVVVVGGTCEGENERECTVGKGLVLKNKIKC